MKEERQGFTRRRFLESTIAGGIAVTTVDAESSPRPEESDRAELERLAEECGSELGNVRRAGR